MADLWATVRAQRACRAFRSDPVDDALVRQALEAATYAPSAENRQPWVFVVVRDDDIRRAIGHLNRQVWEHGARAYSERRLSPLMLADVTRGVEGGVSGAPVIVVVCGDTEAVAEGSLPSSIFPAIQNLLLAATALGLGSALTTLTTLKGRELADMLTLPPHVQPMAVVPLGWPEHPLAPPRRHPVETTTHRDRFGNRWEARP